MSFSKFLIVSVFTLFALGGCSSTPKTLPVHDEVMIYTLPFDLTYLRTLEALESLPDWELEETEKEKGLIRVRNTDFMALTDNDTRLATILIKRLGRNQTSVSFAPHSQRVIGGDQLLERISHYLSREL